VLPLTQLSRPFTDKKPKIQQLMGKCCCVGFADPTQLQNRSPGVASPFAIQQRFFWLYSNGMRAITQEESKRKQLPTAFSLHSLQQ
jgi:hypothetical protein